MKIVYIDGLRLKQGVIAGARRVILMQDNLNKINAFPVPDNDTGTNIALTMQSIAESAINCREQSISGMSQCLADAALMGARGNSGAILAQFFQGLAESFEGKFKATLSHFGEAVETARRGAYEAITEPQEGTIFTIIYDWAEKVKKHSHLCGDFKELLRKGLNEAQLSLKNTPKKLKLLAKAGVVDAGAQGFVHMLEGVHHFMLSDKIERAVGIGGKNTRREKVKNVPEDITFQFCTECLVDSESIDRGQLRSDLSELGNSLIVAGSAEKVRIHVHTNDPETVFTTAGNYGVVSKRKFDDMRDQHKVAYGEKKEPKIALVTDSSCDLPSEFIIRHNIQMVPVQVSFGTESYIDKMTITPKEFYRILQESEHDPKTSQPTPDDFKNTYKELWGHYDSAVSVHLAGAVSGTFQAAQTAVKSEANSKVTLIDSCNMTVGLGLIVAETAKAIEEGCEIEEVVKRAEWAKKNVRVFLSFTTVKYLIRGGRLSKSRGLVARLLNLKPILTLDAEGKFQTLTKTIGGAAALNKMIQLVCHEAAGKMNLRFGVAHANAPEKAKYLVKQIARQFDIKKKDIMSFSCFGGPRRARGYRSCIFRRVECFH